MIERFPQAEGIVAAVKARPATQIVNRNLCHAIVQIDDVTVITLCTVHADGDGFVTVT